MPLKANPSKPREEWATLPAMQPLPVKIIEKPKKVANQFEDGGDMVRFIAEVFDGPYAGTFEGKPSRFTWKVGLTMGSTRAGAKSKLRQIAEAIYGRALTDDEANSLDIEQFGDKPFVVVGHYPKPDAEQLYLTPIGYDVYRPNQVQTVQPAAQVVQVATTAGSTDGYQYAQGGALRWKPGLAAWEANPDFVPAPPPAPVAPPPVPAAQAAPPVPPAAPSVTPTTPPPTAPPPVPAAAAPAAGDIDF